MLVTSGICGWNTMCENMKESLKGKEKREKKNLNRWRKGLKTKKWYENLNKCWIRKWLKINLKEEESKGKKVRKDKKIEVEHSKSLSTLER
jgi:hypothetical protein